MLKHLEERLKGIQDNKILQTPQILQDIKAVKTAGAKIQAFNDKIAMTSDKHALKQIAHATFHGDKDGKKLSKALSDLDRAKSDLFYSTTLAAVMSELHLFAQSESRSAHQLRQVFVAIQMDIAAMRSSMNEQVQGEPLDVCHAFSVTHV